MSSFVMPRRPLSPFGSWDALVGSGWPSYVRVLHPALREDQEGGTLVPVPWREIAPPDIDIATADWHSFSGVRLHTGKGASGWDIEPHVGPGDPRVAPNVFRHLLESTTGACWVGYWTGYGRNQPEGAQALSLGGGVRTYHVVPLTPTLHGVMTAGTDAPPIYPDIAWDEGGSFLMVADLDLPSTMIGCTAAVARRVYADSGLETLLVDPDAPIVA